MHDTTTSTDGQYNFNLESHTAPSGTHKPLFKMTVFGEPCSKANSRKVAMNKATGRKLFIKSKGAREYCESFLKQVGDRRRTLGERGSTLNLITCKLIMYCNVYYGSERKDLDESLIMDCLEKSGVIKNDRQIREKHIHHFIDREFPRSEITLYERLVPSDKAKVKKTKRAKKA